MHYLVTPASQKKENKISIIIGEKVEVFLIGSVASYCAVIELERS